MPIKVISRTYISPVVATNRRRLTIFLFLLVIPFLALAQVGEEVQAIIDEFRTVGSDWTKSDSLLHAAAAKAKELSDKDGELLSRYLLALNQQNQSNLDSSVYLFNVFIDLARSFQDKLQIIYGYHHLSGLFAYQGKMDTALYIINQAIDLSEEIKDSSNIAFSHKMRSNIRRMQSRHEDALEDLFKALKIFEIISLEGQNRRDTRNLGSVNQEIAQIYMAQKDFKEAKIFCEHALKIYEDIADTMQLMSMYNDLGVLNKKTENYPEAEQYYLKVIELSKGRELSQTNAVIYDNLSNLMFEMERFQEGEKFALEALNWASEKVPIHLSDIYNILARNQLALGKTGPALENAMKGLLLAEESHSLEKESDALLTLSMVHEKNNQPSEALDYFKKYKSLQDSLFNAEKTNILHDIETKYETEKKEAAIALLQKQAELDVAQKRTLKIGLLLLALTGMLIVYGLIQKRRKDQRIFRQEKELETIKRNNLERELAFKKKELIAKVLQLASKNEFLQKLQNEVSTLKSSVDHNIQKTSKRIARMISFDQLDENEWSQFTDEFNAVHQQFIRKLNDTYGTFTHSEMRLITLLKMNLSTKEIAHILRISDQSIWKARYRLRKKMGLDGETDLQALLIGL